MKDLTERLRSTQNPGLAVRQQAADALERLTAENAALRKDAERLRGELANIANAKPHKWDEEVRDQFQQWAQNRARAAMEQSQ
jgi:prefoldin subunit 5